MFNDEFYHNANSPFLYCPVRHKRQCYHYLSMCRVSGVPGQAPQTQWHWSLVTSPALPQTEWVCADRQSEGTLHHFPDCLALWGQTQPDDSHSYTTWMFIGQYCTIGKRKTGKNVELIFISAKIHSSGIHSITSKRKILRVLLTDSFMQRQSSATPDYTFDYTGVVPDPVCPVRAERRGDPHQGEAVRLRAVGAGGLQTKQVFVEWAA